MTNKQSIFSAGYSFGQRHGLPCTPRTAERQLSILRQQETIENIELFCCGCDDGAVSDTFRLYQQK